MSAKIVVDRINKMSTNVTEQQIKEKNNSSKIFIAVNESYDMQGTAQIALFVRYVSLNGPKEKLLSPIPLKGQTRNIDTFIYTIKCFDDFIIPKRKIISISTDGAKSMLGSEKRFVSILKSKIPHDVIIAHCIIHQKRLCVHKLFLKKSEN